MKWLVVELNAIFTLPFFYRKVCACGLDSERHSMEAMQDKTKKWTPGKSTETSLPFNFGRLAGSSTPVG